MSYTDAQIGKLLAGLDRLGLRERTVICLWGDHGWHVGEKGITGKTTLWERSTRVPLIYAGPGITAGGRCNQPAELLDIYPTLVELCGLPAKQGLEGHSLALQLRNSRSPRPWPAITTHGPNNHGIRTERWRYVRYADGSEELYDMKNDPNEWDNLASDPGHLETKRRLAQWLPKTNKPPVPGSKTRLIELRDGIPFWEGVPIDPSSKPQ